MRLNFYFTQSHFADHMYPIWNAWQEKGNKWEVFNQDIPVSIDAPVLVAGYGDLVSVVKAHPEAKVILMEHGIGMTYGTPAYADGYGRRKNAAMFLVQSQYVANKFDPRITAPRHVIGIPKLDKWAGEFDKPHPMPVTPTIGLSFHHSSFASIPEAQNAWDYYLPILPELAKRYKVIGTGHPMEFDTFRPVYEKCGIEVVEDFEEVMRRADILCFDCTSAGYEFLVTGKPVILLNCPKFREDVDFGIRFWDYSEIGYQVENPNDIFFAIHVATRDAYKAARRRAVSDLIPNIGHSTELAVKYLKEFCEKL